MRYPVRKSAVCCLLTVFAVSLGAQSRTAEPAVSADPVWEQELRGEVISFPFLQAESAVIILKNGEVKSYSRQGNWLWTYKVGEEIAPYVSRAREGTTYVSSISGTVIAVNRVGRELWKLNIGAPVSSPVTVGWDGRLFILTGSRIYCRTASGFSLWVKDLGSPVLVKPVLNRRGGLAMVLENNELVLVSHVGRIERFQLREKPLHVVPLEITGGKDSYYLFYASGALERIYRNDDLSLSSESLPSLSQPPAAAAGWKEHAAVTLRDGSIQLLSVPDAGVLWTGASHETRGERGDGSLGPYSAAMQFDERGIYVLSAKGVTGFRTSDGRRLWMLRITGAATIPSFSDEGYLYSGGTDRILHTYRVEERRRNIPRSIYGPMPEGSYGLGSPPPSSWSKLGSTRYDPITIAKMHNTIESAIKQGQIGENEPEFVAYLMETAGISLTPTYSPVRPLVRVEDRAACIRLLGYLGSRETIPYLARLFVNDNEPSIKSACCEAIGRIGVDPSGDALKVFTFLLAPDNANLDPQILMDAATATKNLGLFSGPPLVEAGVRLLQSFGAMDFPARVKRHAASELEILRKIIQ